MFCWVLVWFLFIYIFIELIDYLIICLFMYFDPDEQQVNAGKGYIFVRLVDLTDDLAWQKNFTLDIA